MIFRGIKKTLYCTWQRSKYTKELYINTLKNYCTWCVQDSHSSQFSVETQLSTVQLQDELTTNMKAWKQLNCISLLLFLSNSPVTSLLQLHMSRKEQWKLWHTGYKTCWYGTEISRASTNCGKSFETESQNLCWNINTPEFIPFKISIW